MLFRSGRDGRRGGEVEQALRERGSCRVVLGFGEGRHCESESEGQVRGLKAAVREVSVDAWRSATLSVETTQMDARCELELALERRRILRESSALRLEREADEVLAADDDEFLQLWTGPHQEIVQREERPGKRTSAAWAGVVVTTRSREIGRAHV